MSHTDKLVSLVKAQGDRKVKEAIAFHRESAIPGKNPVTAVSLPEVNGGNREPNA